MNKMLAIAALLLASVAQAQQDPTYQNNANRSDVGIERTTLGSGTPGVYGYERALPILENNIFHAPQYMAAFPTAATIWPRVVEVPCTKTGNALKCEGYDWQPKMGRGEYLFFKPVVRVVEPPVVVTNTVVREVPVIVLKEVPAKPKRE